MTIDLPVTSAELEFWKDQQLILPVWWRDDDAIQSSTALDRLLLLAERFDAPLHLAVIPGHATAELADRLRPVSGVFVLTHGWQHANHASEHRKKAEFGPDRPTSVMLDEIAVGRDRLHAMFGPKALPVFTPPWNRISHALVGELAPAGFRALSTFTPRDTKLAAAGLLRVNTHLDPIAWKTGGGLVEPSLLDGLLARHLADRRLGKADNAEPYGILTHHLVHVQDVWTFTEVLLETLLASGIARWTPPLYELGGMLPPAPGPATP